jgi:hypothetical protein
MRCSIHFPVLEMNVVWLILSFRAPSGSVQSNTSMSWRWLSGSICDKKGTQLKVEPSSFNHLHADQLKVGDDIESQTGRRIVPFVCSWNSRLSTDSDGPSSRNISNSSGWTESDAALFSSLRRFTDLRIQHRSSVNCTKFRNPTAIEEVALSDQLDESPWTSKQESGWSFLDTQRTMKRSIIMPLCLDSPFPNNKSAVISHSDTFRADHRRRLTHEDPPETRSEVIAKIALLNWGSRNRLNTPPFLALLTGGRRAEISRITADLKTSNSKPSSKSGTFSRRSVSKSPNRKSLGKWTGHGWAFGRWWREDPAEMRESRKARDWMEERSKTQKRNNKSFSLGRSSIRNWREINSDLWECRTRDSKEPFPTSHRKTVKLRWRPFWGCGGGTWITRQQNMFRNPFTAERRDKSDHSRVKPCYLRVKTILRNWIEWGKGDSPGLGISICNRE